MRKASINAVFGADIRDFSTKMQNVQRQMKTMGAKMQKVGKTMSTFVSLPIAGLGAAAVKAASDIESLKVSLQTALGGTKEQTDQAFRAIEEFASATPYAISEVTNAFIKLKNMGLDPSMEALEAYGNTASAMGKSLDQMVEAVADAAVGEFERLKEFGIKAKSEGDKVSFTFKGVTTTIRKNSKEIEAYLQNIGRTEFAGGIEAQSQTLSGQISTLKDNFSLLAAEFGQIMLPMIKKVSTALLGIAQKFRELNTTTKKIIIIIGALVAGIGPLLTALGMWSSMMSRISAKSLIAMGKILLIVAVIAALALAITYVVKNWEGLTERFKDINWWRNLLITMQQMFYEYNPFSLLIDAYNIAAKKLGGDGVENPFRNLSDSLEKLKVKTKDYKVELISMKDILKDTMKAAQDATKKVTDSVFGGGGKTAEGQTSGAGGRSKRTFEPISVKPKAAQDVIELKDAIEGATVSMGEMNKAQDVQIENSNKWRSSLGMVMSNLKISFKDSMSSMIDKVVEWGDTFIDISDQVSQAIRQALVDSISYFATEIGKHLADSKMGFENFGKFALQSIANFAEQLGKMMISLGTARIALNKLSLHPGLVIAAGAALIAGAAFVRQKFTETPDVALAEGGLVYGPTLSLVGDNPGAAFDPEVVAPLSKLSKMMGGGTVVMDTRLKGDDIYLQQRRTSQIRNRVR